MLTPKEQETESILQYNLILQKNGKRDQPSVQFVFQFYVQKCTHRHSRHGTNY